MKTNVHRIRDIRELLKISIIHVIGEPEKWEKTRIIALFEEIMAKNFQI